MHITPLNNINFGYNKRLNNKLINRLNENSSNPVNKSLLAINKSCNDTEDTIIKLEGKDGKNINKNEYSINILADYLIPAKMFLRKNVDRLYPDLKYTVNEMDSYEDYGIEKIDIPFEARTADGTKRAYAWRDELTNKMIDMLDEDERVIDCDGIEVDGEESSRVQSGKSISGMGFLEKYKPFSYSPTSINDVIGLKNSKDDIEQLIIFPINAPEAAKTREEEYGITIPNFIMFFGPPGCGKTMLTEAIAAQTGCDMYTLDLSNVGSSYVNETASNVSLAFDEAKGYAKNSKKPIILFMDEMDSLLKTRSKSSDGISEDSKALNAILPMLTQARENNIIVIGATNLYDVLDPAVKRRADLKCYIGLPDKEEIGKLLTTNLSKFKKGELLAQNKKDIEIVSSKLIGYSPSNICDMVKAASKNAYKRSSDVAVEDFELALKEGNWEKTDEQSYLPDNKQRKKIAGF